MPRLLLLLFALMHPNNGCLKAEQEENPELIKLKEQNDDKQVIQRSLDGIGLYNLDNLPLPELKGQQFFVSNPDDIFFCSDNLF